MKKLLLILAIPFSLQAQTDSLKVTFSEEKVEKFEKTTLIDEYEKAFGGNRVVKSGLRMRVSELGISNFQNIGIQFEQKISKSVSLIATVGNAFQFAGPSTFESNLEARWYFKMKKKVALDAQKPNITGNYISIKANYYNKPVSNYWPSNGTLINRNEYFGGFTNQLFLEDGYGSINFGKQFGNVLDMFFNLGLKKGESIYITNSLNSSDIFSTKYRLFFTVQSQLGLGILFPKKEKTNIAYCEFLKCNTDLNRLWKLNINNAFYFDKAVQNLKLDLSFERKIAKSAFSLNSNLIVGMNRLYIPIFEAGNDTTIIDQLGVSRTFPIPILTKNIQPQTNLNFGIKEQLRYYIKMKDKMKSGSQGNNLNGIYTGIEYNARISMSNNEQFKNFHYPNRRYINSISGILGYQTLTNKNSFLDVNLAIGREAIKSYYNKNSLTQNWFRQTHFEIGIKLGLAK